MPLKSPTGNPKDMSQTGTPTGRKGICRRNNTLYARIVIPADLREHYPTKEVWRTLQTNDMSVAEYRAAAFFLDMKSEFALHRGDQSVLKDGMRWKKLLTQERVDDGKKLAVFRKLNPHADLTASIADELNLADHATNFSYHLDHVRETQGDNAAAALADIAFGRSLPTLTHLDDWKAAQQVIPRTLVMADTRLRTMADKFPTLPIKKTEVAKWIIELEQSGKAEETIKGLISSCRSYFGFLQRTGYQSEDGPNPFEGHKYTKKKKASRSEQRQPWEVEDVVKLAHAAKQKAGDRNLFSLVVLGAYTGARLEELARLKTSDVKLKDGVRYFEIGEAKSLAGLRDIPMHKDITTFVDGLLARSTDGYLLPNEAVTGLGERSSAIGKRFGRLKTQLGYDGRYVFHSLRKTLSTQLERLGLHHNEAAEIIGHEKVGETYGRYSGGLTISKKADLLNGVSYMGLTPYLSSTD